MFSVPATVPPIEALPHPLVVVALAVLVVALIVREARRVGG